jgi:hypothetical protein
MKTKKPSPIFEAVFSGAGVYPEKIPLNKVSEALSAIQRLAAGVVLGAEDEDEEEGDSAVMLLDVTRTSSAVFRFVGPAPENAILRLKEAGKVLKDPESIGPKNEYVLRPVKDLSAIAKSLECTVTFRELNNGHHVLATIDAESYPRIAQTLLIHGTTTISGKVQRVGGATAMRCALRVPFQAHLLYCKVESEQVARKLGDCLYQRVSAHGLARWVKNTMRLFSFTIQEVTQTKPGTIADHLKSLWEAGLNDWEGVENPDEYLQEVRGNE